MSSRRNPVRALDRRMPHRYSAGHDRASAHVVAPPPPQTGGLRSRVIAKCRRAGLRGAF
jgi:hypothetical protein